MIVIQKDLDTIKTLPNGTTINLSALVGFEELSETQKIYLCVYFDYFPQKFIAATMAGIDPTIVYDWLEDRAFVKVFDVIKSFHAESLASVEYKEAYSNSKIRAQTLRAINAEGYERKDIVKQTTNNTLLITDTMGEITKRLKSAVPTSAEQ